ncbi:N-acetylmuramoyl-L-alanine amidase [Nocardioides sp. WV_118_6]
MADATWLAQRLYRDEFLTVIEQPGWRGRKRPGSFAPIGVLMHHTGYRSSNADPFPGLDTVINGRPDLPGPLCHLLVGYNGKVRVIAAGRANHANTARASGPLPAGDGNTMYIGIEVDYAPQLGQAPSSAQVNAAMQAAAAVVTRLGRGKRYVRAHAETSTTGKWDPGGSFPAPGGFRDKVGWWINNYWRS